MEISVHTDDERYRYLSEERISDSSDCELLVIMLNPATTIETAESPIVGDTHEVFVGISVRGGALEN